MSMTTELAQIKCDIEARKAMPGFGPDTSIERLRIINATQKSFSLETLESLVEALEARDLTLSARDYHYDQQADRIQSLEKALEAAEQNSDGVAGMAEHYETTISMLKSRIAELEARKVKIPYLPDDCDRTEANFKYQAALAAAGIQVIEGEQNNG